MKLIKALNRNLWDWPLGILILGMLFISNLSNGLILQAILCWTIIWVVVIIHEIDRDLNRKMTFEPFKTGYKEKYKNDAIDILNKHFGDVDKAKEEVYNKIQYFEHCKMRKWKYSKADYKNAMAIYKFLAETKFKYRKMMKK